VSTNTTSCSRRSTLRPSPLIGWLCMLALQLPILEGTQLSARDQFVRFSVVVEGIGSPYRVALDDERVGASIYPGEPLNVDLTLWNNTAETIIVTKQPKEWHSALRVTARRNLPRLLGQRPSATEMPWLWRTIGRQGTSAPPGVNVVLGPGRADRVRLTLQQPATDIQPGVYELGLDVENASLPTVLARRRDLRTETTYIAVRDTETRLDVLNQAVHLATRAELRGEFALARSWATKLLSLNPSSVPGLTLLGNAESGLGNCTEARRNWERASTVLRTGGDPDALPKGQEFIEAGVAALSTKMAKCS
jgi:hypothetical protein